MTGSFLFPGMDKTIYSSKAIDPLSWPPKFTKLQLEFSNGDKLAFCDPRRLGRILFRNNPLSVAPISELGTDPTLEAMPNAAELQDQLSKITAPIKSLLLDQKRIFCGLGNLYIDEVLYQAGINPTCKANEIDFNSSKKLLDVIPYVLNTAIEANCSENREYPAHWLINARLSVSKNNPKGTTKAPDGKQIVFVKVGGRTTAIVPAALQTVVKATKKRKR